MTRLLNFERARIPIEKLEDYVLNPDHPEGKHKARVFRELLGIERRHAVALGELIRSTLPRAHATPHESDDFGKRWTTYHEIVGFNGKSAITTVAWLFRAGADETPELISCYIDRKAQDKLRKDLGVE
jgi:hypothetical protein